MRPFDESDLIAYHLHELKPKQARALLQAMQTDPTLVAESAAIATMLAEYKHHTPSDVDAGAVERNWQAIRHALPRVPIAPSSLFRWRLPILAGAGLALAVPIYFAVRHPHVTELTAKNSVSLATTTTTTLPTATVQPLTTAATLAAPPNLTKSVERTTSSGRMPLHAVTSGVTLQDLQNNAPSATFTGPVSALPLSHALPPSQAQAAQAPTAAVPPPTAAQAGSSATSAQQAAAKTTNSQGSARKSHHPADTDLTVSMGGTFIGTRGTTTGGTTNSEGATNAINVSASFHQQFRPFVGYRATVSYTRPQFRYFRSTGTINSGDQGIVGRVYELAGTYVVRGPRRNGVTTYVEAGAGIMALLPPFSDPGNDYNISPAGIVGVAADLPISKHFGVHAAYRAQVFKGPDFHADLTIHPLANSNILISQEPSIGITYRFTQKQR